VVIQVIDEVADVRGPLFLFIVCPLTCTRKRGTKVFGMTKVFGFFSTTLTRRPTRSYRTFEHDRTVRLAIMPRFREERLCSYHTGRFNAMLY